MRIRFTRAHALGVVIGVVVGVGLMLSPAPAHAAALGPMQDTGREFLWGLIAAVTIAAVLVAVLATIVSVARRPRYRRTS